MKQEIKGSEKVIIIGRDANGAEIKIDNSKLNAVIEDVLKDALGGRIKDLEKPEKFSYKKLLIWIIVGTIAFFALAVILNRHLGFGISDDSVVVAFIGAIATFVVISNYMQVRDVKNEYLSKIIEIEDKLNQKTKEIENTLQGKIESTKDFLTNQIRTDVNTLRKNIKFLEYNIELQYNTLQALICYNSQKYHTSLSYCMSGLSYLNKIRTIEGYKCHLSGTIIYYMQRLTSQQIEDKIKLTDDEKASYIKILEENKSEKCIKLINFITNLQSSEYTQVFK
ncbi:MAG: hypothetical protein LBC68_13495 [Prevotellaceae bacterium]|jgi:hypothetical protein|nr:hypothetical protein [Prevotellaceae bacterium]